MKTFIAVLTVSVLSLLGFSASASADCQKGAKASEFSKRALQIDAQGQSRPNRALPADDVKRLLFESWRSTGVSKSVASRNAARNLVQINRESGRVPGATQAVFGGKKNAAVGLFQLIPSTFERIRICGLPKTRKSPLANIAAVVWAQKRGWVTGGILDGSSGWALNSSAPR
jgi:hypothetical protein